MKLPDIISVLVGVDYCLICYRSRFSFLYFEVRVLCRHKKSSRSLSGAKPQGVWGVKLPHTSQRRLVGFAQIDEIFLPLGGGTPAFHDGIRHHTAENSLQHKAQPVLTDYKLPGTDV